jgi:hypothetical protein
MPRTRRINPADDPLLGAAALMHGVARRAATPPAVSVRPAPEVLQAISLLRAGGYRIGRPTKQRRRLQSSGKDRVDPTFYAEFADGTAVRMSICTSHEQPDSERGRRLARQAWASRHRVPLSITSAELIGVCPAIISERFEAAS